MMIRTSDRLDRFLRRSKRTPHDLCRRKPTWVQLKRVNGSRFISRLVLLSNVSKIRVHRSQYAMISGERAARASRRRRASSLAGARAAPSPRAAK
jgi:hypothetical protein